MLGADGVLVGSRLWASSEANVSPRMHAVALAATGDDTIRSQVMDLARKLDWPSRYTARVLRNAYIERWHGREAELLAVADEEAAKYRQAWAEGDPEGSNTFIGEVAGLISGRRAGRRPHRTDGNRGRSPHRRGEKLSSPTARAPAHYIISPTVFLRWLRVALASSRAAAVR